MPINSPLSILPTKEWGGPPSVEGQALSLGNPGDAGSYLLKCDQETLRKLADEADLKLLEADLKGIKGRQNLLNKLAQAASFPPEFGVNWDALADALCDLSWCGKKAGYVLLLKNASDTLGLSANDREIAQDLLADTVVYWRQRKKPFWIFFA